MAILEVSLDEAEQVSIDIATIFNDIKTNKDAMRDISEESYYYRNLKKYFQQWFKFLKYSSEIPVDTCFYRVRPLGSENINGVPDVAGLKYPQKGARFGRMNNHSRNVMYASYHEYTAIAECQLKENDKFQLTRFKSQNPIKVFELGLFSRLYFTTPRDSKLFKDQVRKLFNMDDDLDTTVRGFASLELALMDGLYAIDASRESVYYLTSVISDAIFTEFEYIDAIKYPSVHHRFGENFSFREKVADELEISYTCVNKIGKVYKNGIYKYYTRLECMDFSTDVLEYKLVSEKDDATYR
ncbi:RES domain-containing protein [Kosakonia radicincitans]|uniref:RES domain-containing protein n=1 Tax=Kosakonia radicincitans TaxID=283686 RepID=A0AAX2EZ09_9ENTR|nr:RES domain-containing protein [Kosakonia radicincitans]SFF38770.1 RES domain-containing protein [Kosakonia radicincitans]SFR26121.1 RES domain-containing protein [Kosakonia radicincitans]SFU16523.1 RES domain-containing protein [Kosakonia radicincitans]SFY32556.1 RES domain-containing protein [Kosakonia radicincitans]